MTRICISKTQKWHVHDWLMVLWGEDGIRIDGSSSSRQREDEYQYLNRWAGFDSTARGGVLVHGSMGRVWLGSSNTDTSDRSVGRVRFDYPNLWFTVGRVRLVTPRSIDGLSRVEFDLSTRGAPMFDHEASLLRHAEVCRWWSWVEFGWQYQHFGASSICEHRCSDNEQCEFDSWTQMFWWWTVRVRFANLNVRWQLCVKYFGLSPIPWIY
jgi:hypothetical protein